MKSKFKHNAGTYVIFIALPLAVGILSALLTRGNMQIYKELTTPPLSPPPFLFPIVWTLLYILMGISSATVWIKRARDIGTAYSALRVYALSLLFNFLWSIIFFNLGLYLLAFIWLLVLFVLIMRTAVLYHRISPIAAYLQIPYAAWVVFAGYLNLAIWLLN